MRHEGNQLLDEPVRVIKVDAMEVVGPKSTRETREQIGNPRQG
jgi:hypothetical protein